MIGRPWLASTMSGALLPETASLSVVWRSVNDFATRLIFTFGYFARNAALRRLICAAWPPRTSWSQIVSVTSPALATSILAEFFFASSAFLVLSPESPPGVPQPATSAREQQQEEGDAIDVSCPCLLVRGQRRQAAGRSFLQQPLQRDRAGGARGDGDRQ